MVVLARSSKGLPPEKGQTLWDHHVSTGEIAARMGSYLGMSEVCRFTGRTHDLGKGSEPFRKRILFGGPPVDHSTAGAILAYEKYNLLPVAHVIAGHHTGLLDRNDLKGRLKKRELFSDSLVMDGLLDGLRPEIPAFALRDEKSLYLFTQMLFSILVDSDSLDAERWDLSVEGKVPDAPIPLDPVGLLERLDRYTAGLPAKGQEIDRIRLMVSEACRRAGRELPPGFFSLTAPTGAGKTLSSIRFALEQARVRGHRRVISVIPYLTIIEQTSKVYRDALGEDLPEGTILEHHSGVVDDGSEKTDEEKANYGENWDAPIIVTTSVQFLESLFACRRSRCRKLHNIARSVVLMDEPQTVPRDVLEPTLRVLRDLVADYGVTVLFSTATQPAFDLKGVQEIIPEDEVRKGFRFAASRVKIKDLGRMSWKALARHSRGKRQVLFIVHRRDDAVRLAREMDKIHGEGTTYHLSASMCPRHRQEVLERIRRNLERSEECRVVSTQLIEAGVDISFPVVYRARGGVDSAVQAAGRCNREGLLAVGEFYLFTASSRPPPGVLEQGLDIMNLLLKEGEVDFFDPNLYRRYYRRLYASGDMDAFGIEKIKDRFDFRTVSGKYKIISEGTTSVVVPYDEKAREILERIRTKGRISRSDLRKLQPYSVSVYPNKFERLAVRNIPEGAEEPIRIVEGYDPRFGVVTIPTLIV